MPEASTLISLAKLWDTSIDSILRPIITGFEKVNDTVMIEDVEFTIVEKETTTTSFQFSQVYPDLVNFYKRR